MIAVGHKTSDKYVSHCIPYQETCLLNIVVELLNHSIALWMMSSGRFLTPNSLQMSCIRYDNKLVPPSDKKASGTPNMGTISSAYSLAIPTAGAAYIIGHLVAYLFPLVVTGNFIMSTPMI